MKFSSVKSKLLVLLLISISCSFAILGYYNASNEYNSEYEIMKNKQLNIAEDISTFIDDYLTSKVQVVESVVSMIENKNLNIQNQVLIDQLMLGKRAGGFASMYLGLEESGDLIKFDGVLKSIATMNYDARLRPWYKKLKRTQKSGVTEPFVDNTTKRLVITVFAPFRKDGKLIGVVGANIFLDTIVNEILNVQLPEGGLAYLLSEDGKIIIHKDRKLLKKPSDLFKAVKGKESIKFTEYEHNNIDKFVIYSKVKLSSWYLVIELQKEVIFREIEKKILIEILIYLVLLFAILGFIYIMLRKLLNPLDSLESGLNGFFDYLKGDKQTVSSLNINTNDEFGTMARKIDAEIDIVKENLEKDKNLIENVKVVVNEVKEGKLDCKVDASTNNKSLNELKLILNDMIETINKNVDKDINRILSALDEYSSLDFQNNIADASGEVSKGLNGLCNIINEMLKENYNLGITLQSNANSLLENVNILNKASNETAVSLEETSASIEEITTTIVETTNNISKMVSYNGNLIKSISDGQELASLTAQSMNEINEQTAAIAEAITVIDQIAFQTNILSLNAAVEAATAGEAGKGFAVVAQEVRNLASRSAEAAKEIKELVENATYKTDTGKKNADKMIEGYVELNENINKTTEVINHIEKASNEQKIGMEQINDAVTNLDSRTQQNASVATMTQEISVNTSNIANNILESVSAKKFRKD